MATSPAPLDVALIYDFDGTLAKGNLQEASFIPEVAGQDKAAFWDEVKSLTKEDDGDEVLTYMNLMRRKALERGTPITKDLLRKHGEKANLYCGLKNGEWFDFIKECADEFNLRVKHYILSSGIKEMIEGCPICNRFDYIFACKYHYNDSDEAEWPSVSINYTGKTQYLFRINKGVINNWDNDSVNTWTPELERSVPFERMIFIGDGDTDIPTMKMITHKGGYAIAAYDEPEKDDAPERTKKIHKLISEKRADFVARTDYRRFSPMAIIVHGLMGRMKNFSDH